LAGRHFIDVGVDGAELPFLPLLGWFVVGKLTVVGGAVEQNVPPGRCHG